MPLGARLNALLEAIPPGAAVADVACDHGLLAIAVALRDPAARVIACDLRAGPLAAAARHVARHGLGGRVALRLGDGLAALTPGEVDVVCVAGLGGAAIASILTAGAEVALACRRLVLQPLGGTAVLRTALATLGRAGPTPHLVAETALVDGGFDYEILVAEPRAGADPLYPDEPEERELRRRAGPLLLAARDPVAAARWRGEVPRLRRLLDRVRAVPSPATADRIEELERDLRLAMRACARFDGADADG